MAVGTITEVQLARARVLGGGKSCEDGGGGRRGKEMEGKAGERGGFI